MTILLKNYIYFIYSFFCGATTLLGPRPPHCWGFEVTHIVRSPLDIWSPVAEALPDNTLHSQETDIHSPGGIRTHNPSKRAAAGLRLIPRGHRDRLRNAYSTTISNYCYIINTTTYITHTNNSLFNLYVVVRRPKFW